MRIYQVAGCPYAHRARIVLEEKALPYDIVYFERGNRPKELAALSPDAKSPTIYDDANDVWVWDSLIVMQYLDERYPAVALMPTDAAGRARVRLWMLDAQTRLGAALHLIEEEVVHKPASARDHGKVQKGITEFNAALAPWEARLERSTFLEGDALTLADITLFTPIAAVARELGKLGEIPERFPRLQAFRDRIVARPSTKY